MDDDNDKEWMMVAKEGKSSHKRLGRDEPSPGLRIYTSA
jgi:hypothetical protein